MRSLHRLAVIALLVAAPLACSKPEPPRVVPTSVTVTGVSGTAIAFDTRMKVENPNGFDLSASSVSAKVVLDGTIDLGSVSIDKPFTLPAKGTVEMNAPMSLAWHNAALLLPLAQRESVPYAVDGTVTFGGKLSVNVPFHLDGKLTREQLMQMVMVRLPRAM